MAYQPNDHYARKAKKENFAARSIYKLEEIDQKYKVIHKGDLVLDLGASPGSWSQYAAKVVGSNGLVLGLDLQPVTVQMPNARFIVADIMTLDVAAWLQENQLPREKVDIVISDMAPKTTGVKITDQARSFQLCEMALNVCLRHLRNGGNFVAKFFDGPDFNLFREMLRKHFAQVEVLRPKSTRKESKEIFFVCKGFKG